MSVTAEQEQQLREFAEQMLHPAEFAYTAETDDLARGVLALLDELAATRQEREDAVSAVGEWAEGSSPVDLPGAVRWLLADARRLYLRAEAAEADVVRLRERYGTQPWRPYDEC